MLSSKLKRNAGDGILVKVILMMTPGLKKIPMLTGWIRGNADTSNLAARLS